MMASENDAVVPKNKQKDEEELESWVNEIWDYNNRLGSCGNIVQYKVKYLIAVIQHTCEKDRFCKQMAI